MAHGDGQDLVVAYASLCRLVAQALKRLGWSPVVVVSTLGNVAKHEAQEVVYGPEPLDDVDAGDDAGGV